jgi:SAM-dependent methyltransferase
MTQHYDRLADIYDSWAAADPSAEASLIFYSELLQQHDGGRVELGVGTGRIAIPVLEFGGRLTGVDSSARMLEACQRRAEREGVADRLVLLRQDVRSLRLDEPVALVVFPFRSIGHLLTDSDKLACLRSVFANLAPGGRFVFDHYVWNQEWARAHDGVARLMVDETLDGHRLQIYDVYHYRYEDQEMHCSIHICRELPDGSSTERVEQFDFSWVAPSQVRRWAQETGFEVEALYGAFDATAPFDERATDQIWTLRRPIAS